MTCSIVARDPEPGFYGVAVASRFFAVGALVPHVRGGLCAVATQAFVSPVWGLEAAARLAKGEAAKTVVADLVARDAGQHLREIHVIDARGSSVAHTGASCTEWCGYLIGDGVAVAGNMLAGASVIADTLAAYQGAIALPFAKRLLTATEAGEAAGGSRRRCAFTGMTIIPGLTCAPTITPIRWPSCAAFMTSRRNATCILPRRFRPQRISREPPIGPRWTPPSPPRKRAAGRLAG